MQQATLAQSVEQRIRNAQVVSSSLMSGSIISRIKVLKISQLIDSEAFEKRVIFLKFSSESPFFRIPCHFFCRRCGKNRGKFSYISGAKVVFQKKFEP